eukprot:s284_g13.t1
MVDEPDAPPAVPPPSDLQRLILAASQDDVPASQRLGFAVVDTGATETVGSLEAIDFIMSQRRGIFGAEEIGAAEEIGKSWVVQNMVNKDGKLKSKIQLDRYDWSRVQFSDLRDPRNTQEPCMGSHQIEEFHRGSLSGTNAHALWLTCKECRLRVLYVPTFGAKGTFRSPGPLDKDVKEKLKEDPKPSPHQLKTKELGLEAAEKSAQKLLDNIKKQREKTSGYPSPTKSSPPVKSPSPATSTGMPVVPKMPAITNTSKKASKRESETPAEAHEVQVIEEDAAWDKIG